MIDESESDVEMAQPTKKPAKVAKTPRRSARQRLLKEQKQTTKHSKRSPPAATKPKRRLSEGDKDQFTTPVRKRKRKLPETSQSEEKARKKHKSRYASVDTTGDVWM